MLAYVGKKRQLCLDITYFSRDFMASASVSVVSERAASELPVSAKTVSATTFSSTRCGPLLELFRSWCFGGVRATGGFWAWSPETEFRGFLRLPGVTSRGSGSIFVAAEVLFACMSTAVCRCHGLLVGGGASTKDASDVDQDDLSELRLSLSRPRLDEDPRTLEARPSSELRFILKDSNRARVAADCRWGDTLETGVECSYES